MDINKGNFKVEKQKIKSPVMGDIFKYIEESRNSPKKISKEQSDKIVNALKKNPTKYINSEIYKNKVLDKHLKEDEGL